MAGNHSTSTGPEVKRSIATRTCHTSVKELGVLGIHASKVPYHSYRLNAQYIKERTRLSLENWVMHGACLADWLALLHDSADLDLLGLGDVAGVPTLLALSTRTRRRSTRSLHGMHEVQG